MSDEVNNTPASNHEDPDNLSLGPEVCTFCDREHKETWEYKLHCEEVQMKDVMSNHTLSTMIHAIHAYEALDPLKHDNEVRPISIEDHWVKQTEDPDFKPIRAEENQLYAGSE